jgi:hypothetical protein
VTLTRCRGPAVSAALWLCACHWVLPLEPAGPVRDLTPADSLTAEQHPNDGSRDRSPDDSGTDRSVPVDKGGPDGPAPVDKGGPDKPGPVDKGKADKPTPVDVMLPDQGPDLNVTDTSTPCTPACLGDFNECLLKCGVLELSCSGGSCTCTKGGNSVKCKYSSGNGFDACGIDCWPAFWQGCCNSL